MNDKLIKKSYRRLNSKEAIFYSLRDVALLKDNVEVKAIGCVHIYLVSGLYVNKTIYDHETDILISFKI